MIRLFNKSLPYFFIITISFWCIWIVVKNYPYGVTDDYDGNLIIWIINQHISKIPSDIEHIFQGNIFYPHQNTLAFSDVFLPSALLSYLPVKLMNEPSAAFAVTMIVGQIATLFVVYIWWTKLSHNKSAALIATLALGLSQIRFHYQAHLQMWSMQWWILSLFFLWSYKIKTKPIFLYLASIFLAIQMWESLLPAVWVIFIAPLLLYRSLPDLKKQLRHIFYAVLIFVISSAPIFYVYYSVSNEFTYQRSIRDAANFSMSVDDLWGKFLSPGLFIIGAYSIYILKDRLIKKDTFWMTYILFLGVFMALGPVLKWGGETVKIFNNIFIPLPYGVFYYLIPAFGAFRTPSRWIWLSAFALSGIIAIALKDIKFKKNYLIIIISLFVAIIGGTVTESIINLPAKDEYPKVYKWLKDQPGGVIVELPIYTWGGEAEKLEVYRMLYSLEHRKKLINGYSGFAPPERVKFIDDINSLGYSPDVLIRLENLSVDYILIEKTRITIDDMEDIVLWNLPVVYEDTNHLVYSL